MTISETIIVAGVMAAMLVLALVFASEGFRSVETERTGRQAYVYAAEGCFGAHRLHVWLTNPHLFQFGIIKNIGCSLSWPWLSRERA